MDADATGTLRLWNYENLSKEVLAAVSRILGKERPESNRELKVALYPWLKENQVQIYFCMQAFALLTNEADDAVCGLQTQYMNRYGLGSSSSGRMLWAQLLLREEGSDVKFKAAVCGVLMEQNSVIGLVMVQDGIWSAVKAEVVIDATGDGDVVYSTGIPFNLGSKDDGNVQNSSQWNVLGKSGYDIDVLVQTEYAEVLRGLELAHIMSTGEDFSPLLSPREGGLFQGDYTVSLQDVLMHRCFEDVISVAQTDNDPHGGMSSPLHYMVVTPYHGSYTLTGIPYRACIPAGISGLLCGLKQSDEDCFRKVLCLPRETALPMLEQLYAEEPELLMGALALGWFGDNRAEKLLIKELHCLVQAEDIDAFDDKHPLKPGNNIGGVFDTATKYWKINWILTVLSRLGADSVQEDVITLIRNFTAGRYENRLEISECISGGVLVSLYGKV